MMNFVAISPSGNGNLRAWASGAPPNASVLNYTTGVNVANGVVVPVDQDPAPGADVLVRALTATHVVIDVLGYFSERHPLAGEGRPNAGLHSTNPDPDVFELCLGPTGTYFSLSWAAVPGHASRAACEATSWVCSRAERGTAACDTQRQDHPFEDGEDCEGNAYNLNADAHLGWLADTAFPSLVVDDQVYSLSELGGTATTRDSCLALPVWCCTF
jgi:hypothetical protein